MLKRIVTEFGFWVLVVAVALVMGVHFTEGDQTVAEPSWKEHWDVLSILITVAFGWFVYSARRKLNCIDKKFDRLFQWRADTDVRLTVLETEHKLRTGHDCRQTRHTATEEAID